MGAGGLSRARTIRHQNWIRLRVGHLRLQLNFLPTLCNWNTLHPFCVPAQHCERIRSPSAHLDIVVEVSS